MDFVTRFSGICKESGLTKMTKSGHSELQEINRKYPGFIHMKVMQGLRLSYKLQTVVNKVNFSQLEAQFRGSTEGKTS